MKRVAIVGSERKYWNDSTITKALATIMNIFNSYAENMILVSGGCPKGGIDIWAEQIADILGVHKEIHKPDIEQWEDVAYYNYRSGIISGKSGYKSRNEDIAFGCDVLYCIDPKGRDWSGGRWILERAKKWGRETHLVLIE